MLKKEIAERDLARMRNLITKKYGEKTSVVAGYETQKQERKEGDVWEENGRQFTLQNGRVRSVVKTLALRELVRIPLSCPVCGNQLLTNNDKTLYQLRGACLSCVIEKETQMKISGEYEAYEAAHMKANLTSWVNEMEADLASITGIPSREMAITEAGDAEEWVGGTDTLPTSEIEAAISELKTSFE